MKGENSSGMERTDEMLMSAHSDGDQSAFEELVRRYGNRLFGYLIRMTGNPELAKDLFQETFLRIHTQCHRFRSGALFKPWFFTIATHVAIDALRKHTHQRGTVSFESNDYSFDVDSSNEHSENGDNPLKKIAQDEERQQVRKAIDSLAPKQRAAVILAYYQNLTYPEVANIMKCSVGTVKTQMWRAMRKLAKLLSFIKEDES